jgi:hypothetical protein
MTNVLALEDFYGFAELTDNEMMIIDGGVYSWELTAAGAFAVVSGSVMVATLPVTWPVVATAAVAVALGATSGAMLGIGLFGPPSNRTI